MKLLKRLFFRLRRDPAHYCATCVNVIPDTDFIKGSDNSIRFARCLADPNVSRFLHNQTEIQRTNYHYCDVSREIDEFGSKYCSKYKEAVK